MRSRAGRSPTAATSSVRSAGAASATRPRWAHASPSCNWLPDQLLVSTARRARDTATLIAIEVGFSREQIMVNERLYLAEPSEWREIISALPGWISHAACVGHNPGITELANHFGDALIDNVPTCELIDMTFGVDAWANLFTAKPVAFEFDYPKIPSQ